jgi:elongation factor Ts
MEIAAATVMELREKTGLGMMLCKKALIETKGDMTLAMEVLRKQGHAAVAKRAGRVAKQGKVTIVTDGFCGIVYEVNAETDFVAKNDDFISLIKAVGEILLSQKPSSLDAAKALSSPALGGKTINERTEELIAKIGENLTFRRFYKETFDTAQERLFTYVHGEGRIGVMVKLTSDKPETLASETVTLLGKDLSMQIAASSPLGIDREKIKRDFGPTIEKEQEIYFTQAQTSGKPEKVWPKIVEGKLDKFFKESALVEQPFIRDPEKSVRDRIASAEKEVSSRLTVVSFIRYELGAEEQ